MARKVDHIGILVSNIDEAIKLTRTVSAPRLTRLKLSRRGSEAAILSLGQGANLELLEPLPTAIWLKSWRKEGKDFTT